MAEPIAENAARIQHWRGTAGALWVALVDWVTPPKCLSCKTAVSTGAALCMSCWQKLHLIDEPVCDMLGIPFAYDEGEGALSPAAIANPPPWDRARAVAAFDDASKHLVHLLKYRDTQEAGIAMARMMAGAGRKLISRCDVIVPVPLHRFRLWQRRFNQAAILSQRIGRISGRAFAHDILVRNLSTRPQVGLGPDERLRNVKKAFVVPAEKRPQVDGKAVLLVDDVRTTGATAGECARALKDAGATRVDVLTFALVLEPKRLHIDA